MEQHILWFDQINMNDVATVGGKNASLGEMISNMREAGVTVPNGFATSATSYFEFLEQSGLGARIKTALEHLDIEDVETLAETGRSIRKWIVETPFTPDFIAAISQAYEQLLKQSDGQMTVAVRSSATAEDLPDASFAGQQETFLNVSGIDEVLQAIKHVFASLYNDRAITYRVHHNFAHESVGISAGIQRMVRSDQGASGVIFSIDTESGFNDVVLITASYGLGETIVQGEVNPDEFYVYKPGLQKAKDAILRRSLGDKAVMMVYADDSRARGQQTAKEQTVIKLDVEADLRGQFCLTNEEVLTLAKHAVIIEQHYGRPMDIEWAKDGVDGKLYILQARPETVVSHEQKVVERYQLKQHSDLLCEGRSVGHKIGKGPAKVLHSVDEMTHLQPGDVLVADMTDPDWEPIMKRASAIITNRGGRTCHAAIIARELGIPAVVGCGNATEVIQDETEVTVSCAEGDTGYVYAGLLDYDVDRAKLDKMPELPFKIMLNVGNADRAFAFSQFPNAGVGLARVEFIISQMIGIHPKALLEFDKLPKALQHEIGVRINAYGAPKEYYIERLKEGIAMIASAFYPKPVIVRLSDFKSNEYANLLGGERYEPKEDNPMLGFRGAGRYISEAFRPCFELECQAVKRVREDMGLDNVELMIPFVRTLTEAKQTIELLAENGLQRGENGLRVIMMCEIPSNAVLADEFLEYFDGFSIGSNDLTQLTLGLDRDSAIVAASFDERDPAVKSLLSQAIQACNKAGKYIGICGQGPSDHPDLAFWLMKEGIHSVSLNPDSVIDTWLYLAKVKDKDKDESEK